MRKYLWIPLLGLALVLGGVAYKINQNLAQSRAEYATLRADEAATRERYGQAINEIAAIQDSLAAIVVGDDGTRKLEEQLDTERSLSRERSDETMERIAVIRAGVERAKARIQDLEARLQASDVKVAGLEKLIQNLRASVAEKELKEAGLVVSKGGILGIGRTLTLSGKFDAALFTALDTDEQTVIHIAAEEARVLSDQPVTSYSLVPAGKELDLHILDPQAFRAVKHVVIMTS